MNSFSISSFTNSFRTRHMQENWFLLPGILQFFWKRCTNFPLLSCKLNFTAIHIERCLQNGLMMSHESKHNFVICILFTKINEVIRNLLCQIVSDTVYCCSVLSACTVYTTPVPGALFRNFSLVI